MCAIHAEPCQAVPSSHAAVPAVASRLLRTRPQHLSFAAVYSVADGPTANITHRAEDNVYL